MRYVVLVSDFCGAGGHFRYQAQMDRLLGVVVLWSVYVGGILLDFNGVKYVSPFLRLKLRWLVKRCPVEVENFPHDFTF